MMIIRNIKGCQGWRDGLEQREVSMIRRIAIALVLLSSTALAVDCVTPSGSVTSSPTSDPTVRTFIGTVYPFGTVNGALQFQFDPNIPNYFTGVFAFKAPGGRVYGTVEGQ